MIVSQRESEKVVNNKGYEADMTDVEMIREIRQNQRDLSKKLDGHIADGLTQAVCMQRQLSEIKGSMVTSDDLQSMRDNVTAHKTKLSIMFSSVGVALTAMFAWMVNHMSNLNN